MSYTPSQIARSGTEHAHQAALFCWLRRKALYHPELEWVFAIPNGGSRDKITAGKLKAEGVTPGVFDLFVPHPSRGYHGLWIEMKKLDGRVSPVQKAFGKIMTERGYLAYICYGWEDAVQKIADYFGVTTEYPTKLPQAYIDELVAKRARK